MSYAALFLAHPEILVEIRAEYGDDVYTDNNEVVSASTGHTVAYCDFDADGPCMVVVPADGVDKLTLSIMVE